MLGCEVDSEMVLVELIENGLPIEVTAHVVAFRIVSADEIRDLISPNTTLIRRRKEGRLDAEESDKLVRITRVVGLAREGLGVDKGDKWIRRPNRALRGKVPLDLCRSAAGARIVEAIMGRIGYGVISQVIGWRLCEAPFTALDGEGARLHGNRWNSPGLAVNDARGPGPPA